MGRKRIKGRDFKMKILITAKYLSGRAEEGGSSRFFYCVAQALTAMGQDVILSNQPERVVDEYFDLIICSHNEILKQIKANPTPKVCISHGLIGDENFTFGAVRYISVSEEVQRDNLMRGISSEVIGQPIEIRGRIQPSSTLEKILIIRRHPMDDPFIFLSEKYDVRISDISKPIEDQIAWADLCITLGRGALESMAQGKPVVVADNRPYIGAYGDGYVTPELIGEIARNNFSGRRFKIPVTRAWLEAELEKYDPAHSEFLHNYVRENHDAEKIVARYLEPIEQKTAGRLSFGVMVNDLQRLDMCLKQSEITGDMHFVKTPESATKGLNKLLDIIEEEGSDIAVLTHQDMFYRHGWIEQVQSQLAKLPDNWVIAGIIGKDNQGIICGKFHDMRIPLLFNTTHIHEFPHPACCFDECCIIVNMKSGFRFDETMDGFDLYGTLAVIQAFEMGGTAWIIDAFAEHYCMRPFTWMPDETFKKNYKWLHDRFNEIGRVDSTAIGLPKETVDRIAFMTSAA